MQTATDELSIMPHIYFPRSGTTFSYYILFSEDYDASPPFFFTVADECFGLLKLRGSSVNKQN